MSQSLGEKLRLAREERGISLNEVAEQTRISPHYLQAIEADNYKPLPGGIFNKGFIKSYAKYVGVDEQEALADYSRAVNAGSSETEEQPLKTYRPEVLTDDRSLNSMLPTIIVAAVILALITAAILFGLNYLNRPIETASNTTKAETNAAANSTATVAVPEVSVPTMDNLKLEFKALSEPVSVTATIDGKTSSTVVEPNSPKTFEPKESLKLSYYKSFASLVALTMNGKAIALPSAPSNGRRNAIEFEINKDNLAEVWKSGSIAGEVPAASPETPAEATPTPEPAATTEPSASTPQPSRPTPVATQAKPAATPKKPAVTPDTLPTRKVLIVPSANRPG